MARLGIGSSVHWGIRAGDVAPKREVVSAVIVGLRVARRSA